jgi:3-oxoacyl-(acyl-carrier-protein) synthase
LLVREVPAPTPRPACSAHPRLRRASAITLYAAAAALEALPPTPPEANRRAERLGLIVCILTGCVQYSLRFFEETLRDPATASPLLFPETVFNAPASHLAVLLGAPPVTSTLIGDAATYLQGLALAADWLNEDRVDGCLVVGAEETNWLLADALRHFGSGVVLAGGAGALYLQRLPAGRAVAELALITDPARFSTGRTRAAAAQSVRGALPEGQPGELLCDSLCPGQRSGTAERAAWRDWTGDRLSPKAVLGEGLMASGAWQCVAACDALAQGRHAAATVSVVGTSDQAMGARFVRAER